jgi:hypothetical protein
MIWLPRESNTTILPKHDHIDPKVMVSILGSPLGFPVTAAILTRTKFTVAYLGGDTIPKIVKGTSFDLAKSFRPLMLSMNSTTPGRESVRFFTT